MYTCGLTVVIKRIFYVMLCYVITKPMSLQCPGTDNNFKWTCVNRNTTSSLSRQKKNKKTMSLDNAVIPTVVIIQNLLRPRAAQKMKQGEWCVADAVRDT